MSFPPINPGKPIDVYAGDPISWSYRLLDQDGDPFDLTGQSDWEAQWRWEPNARAFTEITVEVTDPTSGTIVLSMTAEDTAQPDEKSDLRSGVFDVQSTFAGEVQTWIRDGINWRRDVTRV